MAGRAAISGLLLPGLIGAPDIPPAEPSMADSGLVRTGAVAAGACEEPDPVPADEKCDIAEPGRAGTVLVAIARRWAIIASRTLGFDVPMVLFDKPKPGRAPPSGFLGDLGLLGSFCSSLAAVASSPLMIDSALAGQMPAKVQYVARIFSLTPGFASARPFLMHFSIRSRPPVCSTWLL